MRLSRYVGMVVFVLYLGAVCGQVPAGKMKIPDESLIIS